VGFHGLVNTEYFSEAANDFRKSGRRYYTDAPPGSRDYNDYWALHEERCQNGYQVGDIWIPGRYYFYLNFFPMWKIDDAVAAKAYYQFKKIYSERLKGNMLEYPNITAERIVDFPRFTEVDHEWWNFKHIAWNGGSFMGIDSPGGRHIAALKARGAGFSYKEAVDGIYNFNFYEGSKSYYFAGREEYLIKDGILNKVEMGLDFINEFIPFWKQNRSQKKTLMNQKASWLDDKGAPHGSMAEILGVTVDDPNKTRGKRGRKIVFEEGGSFPRLKEALEICLGSIRDGSAYVGQVSLFGTGGEEGPGIEGLDDIFNSPEAWDMMIFPNVWEEGMENESCGYFVPCWRVNNLSIDPVGNVDMNMAIDLENIEREKKKKSSDPKAIDRRKAEYPTNPSEALMRLTVNNFPIDLIDRQLKRLKTNRNIKGNLRHGKYIPSMAHEKDTKMTGVTFIPDPEANPIVKYPHTRNDDLTGCVTIKEEPFKREESGSTLKVVPGERGEIYFITVDPVQLEDSEDLTSLWAVYVWKQPNMYSNTNINVPVAWFVGRPKELETAFFTIFALAKDYNALIQSEIAGGGQAIYTYGKAQHLLDYIAFEMSIDTKEQDVTEMKRNRSYFMNMTAGIKNEGLKKLIAWCTLILGLDEDGEHILAIHNVDDEGFLMEMKKFRANRNADRISQALLAMYMLNKGTMAYELQKSEARAAGAKTFFDRPKFGGSTQYAGQVASAY
jgi:hypothetical protein